MVVLCGVYQLLAKITVVLKATTPIFSVIKYLN